MKLSQIHQADTRVEGVGETAAEYYRNAINVLRETLKFPTTAKLVAHLNYNVHEMGHNGAALPDLKKKNVVHIYIKPGLDRATLLNAICHEMVHAEQIASGRLVLDIENGQMVGMTWEGRPVAKPGYNRNSEWELEAHIKERQLLQHVIQKIGNLML